MLLWFDVALRILEGIVQSILNPLFLVIVGLVGIQHRRIAKNRETFFGLRGGSVILDTFYSTVFGILGGIIGSFLLVLTGVSLDNIGVGYVWPLALFLMLINPRFLCFSYAGGIIGLTGVLFGYPPGVKVPQLMALIAILHMVESFLILVSGHRGAIPIYTRTKKSTAVVGGFTLQKFWPIPLMALTLVTTDMIDGQNVLQLPYLPDWGPLIKPYLGKHLFVVPALMPVLAALGYGDMAIARTPRQKSRISARNLSIYSLILLGLALISAKYRFVQMLAALFAPLGHELVIYLGQRMELREEPVFTHTGDGVMVLEAVSHTLADDMGIMPGDVIYSINGIPVNSKADIEAVLILRPKYLQVEFLSRAKQRWQRKTALFKPNQVLGVIPVPQGYENTYMEMKSGGLLPKIWHKFTH
ncbi:PDZ domain-containing protein [Thermincola potens]|uniref:PDZ/DHR/GLGF domain protein n=1 Tax=Thermincola potens (strain JR) TaxID=635013 RepID=D5XCB9_THEPJ|nr:PDZ domain-containing protein [Thermincola potens]ADG83571.1 PDZ/DHR/GLGF domain protein [Thermincola potens JR]